MSKKTKEQLPTPGVQIIRKDQEVAFAIHLPAEANGFSLKVSRASSEKTSPWPTAIRFLVDQKSREVTVPLADPRLEGNIDEVSEGGYTIEAIAFNGEAFRDSLPATLGFTLNANEVTVLRGGTPPVPGSASVEPAAESTTVVPAAEPVQPAAPVVTAAATTRSSKSPDKGLVRLGEKIEQAQGANPKPAQTPPATPQVKVKNLDEPDILLRGLHLSVRVDWANTKFLEIVGKDSTGREVFPLKAHETNGNEYLAGHLRKLEPDQNILAPGEITLQATAIGKDGQRSQTAEHKFSLTANNVIELKPKTAPQVPPPATPATRPEGANKPEVEKAPAKPSKMDEVIARIKLLADQESVDKLGVAVASGTELLAGKSDKLLTAVGATTAAVGTLKDELTSDLKEIKGSVADLANKPVPPPPQDNSEKPAKKHGHAGNGTAWLVILAIVAIVAIVGLGAFVFSGSRTAQAVSSTKDSGQVAIMDALHRLQTNQEESSKKLAELKAASTEVTSPNGNNDSNSSAKKSEPESKGGATTRPDHEPMAAIAPIDHSNRETNITVDARSDVEIRVYHTTFAPRQTRHGSAPVKQPSLEECLALSPGFDQDAQNDNGMSAVPMILGVSLMGGAGYGQCDDGYWSDRYDRGHQRRGRRF